MLKQISGNARACLMVEPMFIIPYCLFSTYASVYMLSNGLSETEIGIVTSAGLLVQILSSFVSGFLTDRMGRKKALLLFDLLSWSVGTFLWAFSNNFVLFLAAAAVNGFQKIPHVAWTCLIVEDTEAKKRSTVYTILQFISVVGGLFAPLGGMVVSRFSLVPAMRFMYIFAFISMTLMFIIRHMTTSESEMGKQKLTQAGPFHIGTLLGEYIRTAAAIIKNKQLCMIFVVYILFQFQLIMQNTYLSIYLVNDLSFKDSAIAWFPAISSVCMLVLLAVAVPKFQEKHHHHYMMTGFFFSIAALILLVVSRQGAMLPVIMSTILLAAGLLLSNPYLETAVANAIEDKDRANMFSILNVFVLLFISPAGIIGGVTYNLDSRLPFLLMVIALFICLIIIYQMIRNFNVITNKHNNLKNEMQGSK